MTPVAARAATTRTVDVAEETPGRFRRTDADARYQETWSPTRLSAAVAITRPARAATPFNDLLTDELEFLVATGTRHEVRHGVVFVRRGEPVRHVYLVKRGAVAAVSGLGGRRPISAFALPNEVCCAIPALLREPAAWDGVTVANSCLITVPVDRFNAAVRDGWTDRWATRALWWLTEFGARAADFDAPDLTGQVAALLLRHRDGHRIEGCAGALADVLDVDEGAIGRVLVGLRQLGAVRLAGTGVTVAQPEMLQEVTAARRTHSASAPA